MDKERRKSNRQFDLEKKSARTFDLEKEPVGTAVHKKEEKPNAPIGKGDGNGSVSKKRWWIIAIVIIAVVVFFLTRECGGSGEKTAVPVADSTSVVENAADTTADTSSADEQGSDVSSSTADTDVQPSEADVQPSKVNDGQGASTAQDGGNAVSTATEADIQRAADRVLDGEFGNGAERKQKLGSNYAAVQRKVNEMYRKGLAPKR